MIYRKGLINQFRIDEQTGCWNFTGSTDRYGYGRYSWRGVNTNVHRVAAILWLGLSENDPREVCHSCDNPRCFNPKHLFVASHRQNMLDALNKGRGGFLRRRKNLKGALNK